MLDFFCRVEYNESAEVIMERTLFKRKEVKYLLDETTFRVLKEELSPYLEEDDYPEYTICNLYFDTEDFDSIRTSRAKPSFKQKMRLRSYGIPDLSDGVFLELKKKFEGIVYKRRIKAPYKEMISYLDGGELPVGGGSAAEIDYTRKRLNLSPKVYLAYDRIAFHGKEDPELRVTFDHNVRYRVEDRFSFDGGKIVEEGYIMEVKTASPYPRWLLNSLEKNKIYPRSYSKYGKVYEDILRERKEKTV